MVPAAPVSGGHGSPGLPCLSRLLIRTYRRPGRALFDGPNTVHLAIRRHQVSLGSALQCRFLVTPPNRQTVAHRDRLWQELHWRLENYREPDLPTVSETPQ